MIDLEFDSSVMSPEEIADKIVDFVRNDEGMAFSILANELS